MQHDFILLDRSGSMSNLWAEAINSINSYVHKLAKDDVDTGVTLAVFDSDEVMNFDILRDRIIPSTWHDVKPTEARPRGFTPLSDAVGRIVSIANKGNYEKVAIIIMTDGHENSSKEFNVASAKKLLDDCRAKGWQVIFMGADFDNAAQAAGYGAAASNTISVSKANLGNFMNQTASMRGAYGKSGAPMVYDNLYKAFVKPNSSNP